MVDARSERDRREVAPWRRPSPSPSRNEFHRHPATNGRRAGGRSHPDGRGQPPRTLKVGDSAISRAVHSPQPEPYRQPARTIELNIIDKDKPALELVTETQ